MLSTLVVETVLLQVSMYLQTSHMLDLLLKKGLFNTSEQLLVYCSLKCAKVFNICITLLRKA